MNDLMLTIGNETHTIWWWARNYEINYTTLYSRYKKGLENYDLLEPLSDDKISKDIVHRRWGGKWVYTGKKTPKRYKDNRRWVYVPEVKEQIN